MSFAGTGRWPGWLFSAAILTACPKGAPVSVAEPAPDGATITCAVTGQRCIKTADTRSAVLEERNYYFCSDEAWRRFQDAPARYRD